MTDKEKIRKEVERLKGWNNNVRNSTRHMTLQEEDFNRGKHSSYLEILDFIDSLQEEPVSEELEEFALQYAGHHAPHDSCMQEVEDAVKAGAKWGRNQAMAEIQAQSMALAHGCPKESVSNDLEEAADNCYFHNHAYARESFIEGANWQRQKDEHLIWQISSANYEKGKQEGKEQIMENATEAIVAVDAGGYPYIPQIELYDYDNDVPLAKDGDKYKVVLIKED